MRRGYEDESPDIDDDALDAGQRRVAERAALKGLDAVYRKAGSLLAGFTCNVSGDCCKLATTRREPYLFPIEMLRIERALAAAGREMPPARADGACRLLDETGVRCSIYADRPFGCRTFFCSHGRGPRTMPVEELHRLTAQLTRVSDALDPEAEPQQFSDLLRDRDKR